MRRVVVFGAAAVFSLAGVATVIAFRAGTFSGPRVSSDGALLANRWKLTPVGAQVQLMGDMPGTILLTPDGRYAVVNTCGYHNHSVNVVDLGTNKITSQLDVGQDWVGMALGRDGTLYVSGASGAAARKKKKAAGSASEIEPTGVLCFSVNEGVLTPKPGFSMPGAAPTKNFTSGLLTLPDGSLVVADVQADTIFKVTTDSHLVLARQEVGYRPYGLALSPDGSEIAVSNWGDKTVSFLSATDLRVVTTAESGSRPNALAYASDGRLFVANSGDNTVSVFRSQKLIEKIRTSLDPSDPMGAAPEAVALSKDGSRLYIANADNNDVAVVDTSRPGRSRVLGFIPTGRYPCALALAPDGRRLLVGVAKGLNDNPNVDSSNIQMGPEGAKHIYVADLMQGYLGIVDLPDAQTLAQDSRQVRANRPVDSTPMISADERSARMAALKKIHHVIYIIKENRTYDQVLGDMGKGNGDSRLTLFGESVTPNIHHLANTFSLLDNLYCDGEVSQVGHQWTDAAYAADYTQKQWILSYSGRQEVVSDPRLTSSPGDYIWDDAKKHGKSIRIYGEYVKWQEDHNHAHGDVAKDPEKFDCSAAFEKIFAGGGRDTEKVAEFLDEMHAAEKTGVWPNMMVMALPEDHTSGLRAGGLTPQAMVASNDQAVGRLIDELSHSRFWADTAVFVIEDDAQDGPDHVDTHRTEGLFISPYVKRGIVDSTMYSTSSMIKTMEVILGLPPLSQYDKAAMPMLGSVTPTPDLTPYSLVAAKTDLNGRNPEGTALAARSAKLDFSDIDRADPAEFNAILWEAIKPGQPMPTPVHGHIRELSR